MLMVPFLAAGNYYSFKNKDEGDVLIRDVIDGDTIVTEDKVRIRLMAIDAPELEFCLGNEAKKKLEELVAGKKVRLESVAADGFNRVVALVYDGQTLINEEMLRLGMARFGSGNKSQRDRLKEASNLARGEKLGIFSLVCYQTENRDKPECTIKGNREKGGKGRTYHFLGCSGYEGMPVELDLGDEWFCSEKEAEAAGYVKSKQCFGKDFLYTPGVGKVYN